MDLSKVRPELQNRFGIHDGGEQLKAHLAVQIYRIIKSRGLTHVEAGAILGIKQPHVSALMRNRLGNFSVERLMEFLIALRQDVEITVRPLAKNTVRHRLPSLGELHCCTARPDPHRKESLSRHSISWNLKSERRRDPSHKSDLRRKGQAYRLALFFEWFGEAVEINGDSKTSYSWKKQFVL